MNTQAKKALTEAEVFFHNAKEELLRPEEDVVPYSACRSFYHAVVNYLNSFLLDNNKEILESANVEYLLNNCRDVDAKFSDLHLVPMYNPTKSEDVWMNPDTVKDYMVMAEKTRHIVYESIQ